MFVRELLNGTVKATYLVGPRGPEYRRDDQAGTIRWYVYDGLGSVVGEVAPDGTLTRAQSFDVYGCVRTSSGAATTKHKFVGALGHPSDDETGLIYMRARHMDPVCGRFESRDTYPEGNRYGYCQDNPVTGVDPTGHVTLCAVLTGGFCDAFDEAAGFGNAMVARKWGENAIQRILMKWAEKFSPDLLEEEFGSFTMRAEGQAFRMDICGVDGRYRLTLDMLHDVPHISVYEWAAPHLTEISTFFP
jgi:RHS repeat-associated protein